MFKLFKVFFSMARVQSIRVIWYGRSYGPFQIDDRRAQSPRQHRQAVRKASEAAQDFLAKVRWKGVGPERSPLDQTMYMH